MLGDYETASATLRLLASDTKADRAYKAYAGVQEALGAAAVLAGAPPAEAAASYKEAFYRYSQVGEWGGGGGGGGWGCECCGARESGGPGADAKEHSSLETWCRLTLPASSVMPRTAASVPKVLVLALGVSSPGGVPPASLRAADPGKPGQPPGGALRHARRPAARRVPAGAGHARRRQLGVHEGSLPGGWARGGAMRLALRCAGCACWFPPACLPTYVLWSLLALPVARRRPHPCRPPTLLPDYRRRTPCAPGCCWSRRRTACWRWHRRTPASLPSTSYWRGCATTWRSRRGWRSARIGALNGWTDGGMEGARLLPLALLPLKKMFCHPRSRFHPFHNPSPCLVLLQPSDGDLQRQAVGPDRGTPARHAGAAGPRRRRRPRGGTPLHGHAGLPPGLTLLPAPVLDAIHGGAAGGAAAAGAGGGGSHGVEGLAAEA